MFLASAADIAIFGGAAGGGKSYALLMEPLRHVWRRDFGAVVFRRTSVQIRNEGGLWDESAKLYPGFAARPQQNDLWWRFPAGASVSFAHLEHEKNKYDWQGAQIPLLCFDELVHFSETQFWYMVSRNRSTSGVRPYIRATCNPDADSWVATFIAWWIDQDTGYAIPERAGVLRWFVRVGEKLIWADQPQDLAEYVNPVDGEPIPPKSVTFIPSKLSDNRALMKADPGYLANLLALPLVERERLLNGNWKIRWQGQTFFSMASLLVDGQPIDAPAKCDAIFAIIDTATKTGKEHDGTAVTWWARNRHHAHGLVCVDYDYVQVEGALLDSWLPSVFQRGEALARQCGARGGFVGALIEDKSSGQVLLQQGRRRSLNVRPIPAAFTALGKDERALSVSGYVSSGQVKLARQAYERTVTFKDHTKNHLTSQIEGFAIADPDAAKRADDLLDTFVYGVAMGLGDKGGW